MYKPPEETKKEDIEAMGEPLSKLYYELWQEVSWLYFKWDEYEVLFGTKPSRIDLMNESAPFFFYIVEKSFWENILLHIAKIMDPQKSTGKENLSIQRIPLEITDLSFKQELIDCISIAVAKTAFCRDWRNRRIAHLDYNLAIKNGAKPLPPASRVAVKEAISSIANVLNIVSLKYLKSSILFNVNRVETGAESLLRVISDGLKVDKERRKRIESGQYHKDDFLNEDI